MAQLSPIEAALAAKNVYDIIDSSNVARYFHSSLTDNFQLDAASRFEGKAGAFIFKYRSGFGVIAKGKGKFEGEALLSIRGTDDLFRDLILTDLNIGIQTSSTGKQVHQGFNKVFKSFEADISRFFHGFNPTRVHCVGHSLGGALATMAADWIRHRNIAQTNLYTFGSPRVGGLQFAQSVTQQVKPENIFRAYHKTDVVSMIPLWPFTHVPQPGTECFIDSPGVPWITYHKMEKYIESVQSSKEWDNLRVKQPAMDWDAQVDSWLGSSSPLQFAMNTVTMIQTAIMYVLKKIMQAVGIGFQAGLSTGLTLLDRMAMVMAKGAQASKEIGGMVMSLLQRIMSLIGGVVSKVKEITFDFIRWVLVRLTQALYQLASRAIEAVHKVTPV